MTKKSYPFPPVEEAICEFHFTGCPEVDFQMAFSFFEKLKGEYPGKMRRQHIMQAGLQATLENPEPTFAVKQGEARIQYLTEDGTRIVGISRNVLSVHSLRPYEGWKDSFRDRIARAFTVFRELAQPAGVRQIVFRYINRIALPNGLITLSDYFVTPPQLPQHIPMMLQNILCRLEAKFEDPLISAVVTLATLESAQNQNCFLLDIGVSQSATDGTMPLDEALSQAENLKWRGSDLFEAMITEKTRELFHAEPNQL